MESNDNTDNIVKMAGIQICSSEDRDENLRRAGDLVKLAAEKGARVICLPELFSTRWFPHAIDKKNMRLAEDSDGPTVTAMKEAARETETVIICPVFERDGDDFYNTAFVLGPGGEELGKYRKIHVPQIPLWEERTYFKPGDLGFPVIDTPYGKIGIQLCWDTFFPEGFRILALKGAEIVFVPTAAAFSHSQSKWDRALAAAAHLNGLFIFRVNRVGREERQDFYGRSFCLRPDGEFASDPGGSGEGVILSNVNLTEISIIRNDWVFMKDRRPEEYGELLEKKD
ncbi:MAG: nitrilase-related carbon-nitrogen hydrolase [Thermodesulfobacteriota bacterium]